MSSKGQNWFDWKKWSGWWARAWPSQATCHDCGERVAEVLGDVCAEVQDERPVHDHREQAGARDQREQLATAQLGPLQGLHRR